MSAQTRMTLQQLGRGVVIERFDELIQEVAANILDPNTSPTATRTITLTITIKPTDARDMGTTTFQGTAKLAPKKGSASVMYFGRDRDGEIHVSEKNINQPEIPGIHHIQSTKAG